MFSLTSIKNIFSLFDFDLIDALPHITHGGSKRYVVGRKNIYKISNFVKKQLDYEKKNNLDNLESCLKFKENCESSKTKPITANPSIITPNLACYFFKHPTCHFKNTLAGHDSCLVI